MPRVFDPRVRGDMAVEAVCSVILNGGLPALSVRPEAVVVAPGTSCRHQLHDLADRRALHPLEVLAQQIKSD